MRSLAGEEVASLKLLRTSSVKTVKQRLRGLLDAQIFCQRLICGTAAAEDDAVLTDFPQPIFFTVVVLPINHSKGPILLEAASRGCLKEAESALRDQADLFYEDPDGKTALFMASRRGHAEMVHFLGEAGAGKDAATHAGRTPLHVSSLHGHAEVVRVLCEERADPDKVVSHGHTPVYIAAQQGHVDVVRILCDAGANKQKAGQNGNIPLHIASRQGHAEVVRYLCQAGVDRDAAMENGYTSLHIAARQGHLDVVKFLIEEVAADMQRVIDHGITPLYAAAREGHLEVVRYLCQAGANRDAPDDRNRTPARIAAQHGHIEVVRYLCNDGTLPQECRRICRAGEQRHAAEGGRRGVRGRPGGAAPGAAAPRAAALSRGTPVAEVAQPEPCGLEVRASSLRRLGGSSLSRGVSSLQARAADLHRRLEWRLLGRPASASAATRTSVQAPSPGPVVQGRSPHQAWLANQPG